MESIISAGISRSLRYRLEVGGGVCVKLFVDKLREEVLYNVMPNFRDGLSLEAAMQLIFSL